MKAVIMAGGFGTRLRPLSINVPKPMVPIGTLPMMEHVVSLLREHGITELTSLLYFQPQFIKNHFGDGAKFGVKMDYALPGEDFGTAGAVRYAVKDSNEPTLVISGDLITNFDLASALDWHKKHRSDATLLLTRAANPISYGIVITAENGRIVRFLEKPSWGEAFSDTINTGIYILEPNAVELIPKETNFDFSQNLFPLMLSKGMGLYGKEMSGYWKDVGNVAEYRLVHEDIYSGRISPEFHTTKTELERGVLYSRDGSLPGEDVTIEGTVILGTEVSVGNGTLLRNCTIGDRSVIGGRCQIKESVIWENSSIGSGCTLSSAVVCNTVQLEEDVQLLDKAIISDNCTVGKGATVRANCKVWPDKNVEAGAIVSSSLVWGEKWNRELFTDSKVTGLALTEISPEMCVRLGAAFGATLGKGTSVVTSRDGSDITRLLRRSFISGLLAAGVDVTDLEAMPIPIVRHALTRGEYSAGMYMRHDPEDHRRIDIILLDGDSLDMPTARLKNIERNYFGEDFQRASLDEIGHLSNSPRVIDDYRQEFISVIDVDIIKSAGLKIVIDYGNGASSQVFPDIFDIFGVAATELNGSLNSRRFSQSSGEQTKATVQLSTIVSSLHVDLGISINPASEKITIVDEFGKPIENQLLLLLVIDLFLRTHTVPTISVPVTASMGVEQIASEYGVKVLRVPSSHRDMMKVHLQGGAQFVGGTRGGFIFPGFQRGADAMMSMAKILEMMAKTNVRFGDIRKKHEHFVRESLSVPCPWAKKGLVMRRLITESTDKERQLVDGVRIFEKNGWVLVAPDRSHAAFNIIAETTSTVETSGLIEHYRKKVLEWRDS